MPVLQILLVAIAIGLAPAAAQAGGQSIAGLARTCAGCHGPAGASPGRTIPTIAGLGKQHLADAMALYKSGGRSFYVMQFIAKGLSADEIEGLAQHFATRPFVTTATPVDAKVAKIGEPISASCDVCHGIAGGGSKEAPRLAGQPAEYLEVALQADRSGARSTSQEMDREIRALSPEAIRALSHFYAGRR